MAVRTILIIGVMTAAAAGCLDVTSVEVAPPDASVAGAAGLCQECMFRENSPEQPGCSESFSACSQNDACLSAYLCSVDKGCYAGSKTQLISCGMPCASEAGIASLNDPAIAIAAAFFQCMQGPCGPACFPNQ